MNDIPKSLTVLIIDDNPDDRDAYIRLLKKSSDFGFLCYEASDGLKGLDTLQYTVPDCILLDYSLPGSNGIDVLRQIKARYPAIPIIMLTGQGNEAIAVQAIKLGAGDYLAKSSMTTDSLCHAIHMALQYNRLQNKIAEQTELLLNKEKRYQQLINGVHDYAFCWLDRDGCVESWNSGGEKMTGYVADEILGRAASLFYADEDRAVDLPAKILKEAAISGKCVNECRQVRKDGTSFWANVQIDALYNDHNVIGFVSITRDITERRNAERDRQRLIEKLMQSNTELERFAYVASHDMQEPVRMVVNFSKIIASEYQDGLGDEGKQYFQFIIDSADRIHTMIDDLLDYARLDGECSSQGDIDCNSGITHVLDNLGILIKESQARVTCDELPHLNGNPIQFMRLMQNLIANAIKYQPPGNQPVIHVGAQDTGDAWQLSVKDNGMGVDEAFSKKIFEPFRRLHNWEQIKGAGLGLSVCKKIVENHGGKIWMESTLGQGSTFFVAWPKHHVGQEMAA